MKIDQKVYLNLLQNLALYSHELKFYRCHFTHLMMKQLVERFSELNHQVSVDICVAASPL